MSTTVQLEQKEIRILVQSLENCLRTCEAKARNPDAPCEDCDTARTLKTKLERRLAP
jgi:hypothetical protein